MGLTTRGDSVQVSITPVTSEEGRRNFDALAEGGTVVMPCQATFWGADYGALVGKFGINRMLNYEEGQAT